MNAAGATETPRWTNNARTSSPVTHGVTWKTVSTLRPLPPKKSRSPNDAPYRGERNVSEIRGTCA